MNPVPYDIEKFQAKALNLVTGKGGVGKSYVAEKLARKEAVDGKKTLLAYVSLNAPVSKQTDKLENLDFLHLNLRDNLKDFVLHYFKAEKLINIVLNNKLVNSFVELLPGLFEISILGRLCYEAKENYDAVFFDSYASGHFLDLMSTPESILATSMAGPLREETLKVEKFLYDENFTHLLYVLTRDELVVDEFKDFKSQLEKSTKAKLSALIFNKYFDNKDFNRSKLQKTAPELASYLEGELSLQTKSIKDILDSIRPNISGKTEEISLYLQKS